MAYKYYDIHILKLGTYYDKEGYILAWANQKCTCCIIIQHILY